MKIFGYSKSLGSILLYAKPLNGNNFNDWNRVNAQKVLDANRTQFRSISSRLSKGMRKHIRRLKAKGMNKEVSSIYDNNPHVGVPLIAIPYDPCSPYVGVINTVDILGHKHNFSIVKLYQGKEYSEYGNLPVEESFSIYEAWHWAPLAPSPSLHEKIIHAAGMVSDAGYYHQDGSAAFYGIHLQRMRLYVEHFTTIPLDRWDAMIQRAPKSGPGMIKTLAAFCQGTDVKNAVFENKPNIGNLIDGFSKMVSGRDITNGESVAMVDAMKDEEILNDFLGIFKVRKEA